MLEANERTVGKEVDSIIEFGRNAKDGTYLQIFAGASICTQSELVDADRLFTSLYRAAKEI